VRGSTPTLLFNSLTTFKKMEESEDLDNQIREGNKRLRERREEQNE